MTQKACSTSKIFERKGKIDEKNIMKHWQKIYDMVSLKKFSNEKILILFSGYICDISSKLFRENFRAGCFVRNLTQGWNFDNLRKSKNNTKVSKFEANI